MAETSFKNRGDLSSKIQSYAEVCPNYLTKLAETPSHKILFIKSDGREESKSEKEIEVMQV